MSALDRMSIPDNLLDRVTQLEYKLADLQINAATPVTDPNAGDGGVTYLIDGTDLTDFMEADFLMLSYSSLAPNERLLQASDGIDLSDGGAGALAELSLDVAFSPTWTGTHTFQADIQLDADLDFVGAQSITTTAGDLTIYPAGSTLIRGQLMVGDADSPGDSGLEVNLSVVNDSGSEGILVNYTSSAISTTVGGVGIDTIATSQVNTGYSNNTVFSGHRILAQHEGPGTMGQVEGVSVYVVAINGIISSARGISIVVGEDGGTINTAYGLYVNAITNAATNYAIYTQQGTISFGDDIEFRQAATISTTAGDLTFTVAGGDIFLTTGVTIGADNFVSQTTGWSVSYAGAADFRSIYADELYVKAFIAEIYSALAGALIITKSRARLSRDFTIPNTSSSETLYVEDHEGFEGFGVFSSGDYVCLRVIDLSGGGLIVADVYGQVTSYTDLSGGEQSWIFTTTTLAYSSADVIYRGSIALDYGIAGDGLWQATVLDTYSPYSEVQTFSAITSGEPATFTTHVRLGNLEGLSVAGAEFGLFAGTGQAAADGYILATDTQVTLHNIDLSIYVGAATVITLDASTPYFSLGAAAPTAYTTGDGIWMGSDSGTYKLRAGVVGGKRLAWDGTDLYIYATSTTYLRTNSNDLEFYAAGSKVIDVEAATTSIILGPYSSGEYMTLSASGLEIFSNSIKVVDIDNTGDFIFGQVAASKANLFWDQSAGRLNFRGNTTVQAYVDTDGSIVAGTGAVWLNTDGANFSIGDYSFLRFMDGATLRGYMGMYESGVFGSVIFALNEGYYSTKSFEIRNQGLRVTSGNAYISDSIYIGTGWPSTVIPSGTGKLYYETTLQSVKNSTSYSVYGFHPLAAPLTSASWNGNAYSTTAKTLIDLSAVFSGVPAGITAVLISVAIRDSASTGSDARIILSPNNTASSGPAWSCGGQTNDTWSRGVLVVPCSATGDIYYQIAATGSGTMDVYLSVWGYWI